MPSTRRSSGAEGMQPRGVRKRALEIMKQWKKENKERKKQKLTEWWEEPKTAGCTSSGRELPWGDFLVVK